MKKKALFILGRDSFKKIYGPKELERISELVEVISPPLTSEDIDDRLDLLSNCQIIMSGWNGPRMDGTFLEKTPGLEAVFYGAGSIRGIATPEFWKRDIVITSSWAANAVPVSEYTFAQIIMCLKNAYRLNFYYKEIFNENRTGGRKDAYEKGFGVPNGKMAYGAYGTTVGIISLGMIGRLVCEKLKTLDVEIIAYDPYVGDDEMRKLGVTPVPLDELFMKSHVVSLHAPWITETEGMIEGRHFEMMQYGASFINTARGAVVDEPAMISVLENRRDITAVLDVTWPEPPDKESALFRLENVFMTPHIAGSLDDECQRMGKYAVDELERYLKGEELRFRITEEKFNKMA